MKTSHKTLLLSILLMTGTPLQAKDIPTDTLLARLYTRAADLMEEGHYNEAQRSFDTAFATRGVEQSPIYPILLNEQGTLFVYAGKMKEAMELKKRTLRYLPQVDDLEKHISVYTDLAILYRRQHRNDSAVHYYGKALDAAMKYGDDGWIAHIYNNIMVLHFNIRQLREAESFADLALPYAQKSDDIFVTFTTHQLRSAIKNEVGKTREAEESVRKAWSIACRAEGNADTWKMQCLPCLLKIFMRQEKPDSITRYLKLGDELLERVPPTTVAGTGYLQARASAEMARRNYAKALDDLQCAWATMEGFLQAKEGKSIPVCCIFDNEEVGSNTQQGADSTLLLDTLSRICAGLGMDYREALAHSFMVSADNAHALHPNHPEYADQNHRPVMNGGIVIKFNANQRYTTDGVSAALFRQACKKAGVPTQTFCNRADLAGGSTLGNISSSQVSIPTVDVGLPQLAMHSCYETAGARDAAYLVQAMSQVFSMHLTVSGCPSLS